MKRILLATLAVATLTSGTAMAQGLQPSGTRAGGPGQAGAPGEIMPEQRDYVRGYAMRRPARVEALEDDIEPGYVVPSRVKLVPFARDAYGTYPEARRYRYFRTGDHVVLVDPATRQVVEVID